MQKTRDGVDRCSRGGNIKKQSKLGDAVRTYTVQGCHVSRHQLIRGPVVQYHRSKC